MRKILVVANLMGLRDGYEAERFIKEKINVCLRSTFSLSMERLAFLQREVLPANKIDLSQIAYFGDRAYDIDALLAVRADNGLSVVLNGNIELLSAMPISLRSRSAWPVALLVAVFAKWGIRAVFQMVLLSESPRDIQHLMLFPDWEEEITAGLAKSDFKFRWTICPVGFKRAGEMAGGKKPRK